MGGGRGTRLYPLTKYRCKPAVPLAGKYRLVDIPISNCLNSGLNKIYLLSQFNTASLHKHIQQSYKFDSFSGGFVDILAAEQTNSGGNWYQGTADAVRKNMHHFESHSNDTLYLILSGDQLYQMDFAKMIDYHIKNKADITIAAKPMPKNVVNDLGVMRVDDELNITEFVEKPKEQNIIDSLVISKKFKEGGDFCLASMGIYVFSSKILEDAMRGDQLDFGKEVIPSLLGQKKLKSFIYDEYWEDIGTVGAFFETNLALADTNPPFDFYNQEKIVYTHSRFLPASKIYNSSIDKANVADGCVVKDSHLNSCMIGIRSIIREGCKLHRVVMMGADYFEGKIEKGEDAELGIPKIGLGKNCSIENAIIDKNARIGNNVILTPKGKPEGWEHGEIHVRDGIIIVNKNAIIPDNFRA